MRFHIDRFGTEEKGRRRGKRANKVSPKGPAPQAGRLAGEAARNGECLKFAARGIKIFDDFPNHDLPRLSII